MNKYRVLVILLFSLLCVTFIKAQITVQIVTSSGSCGHNGIYFINDNGIVNGKKSYADGAFTQTSIEWSSVNSRWEVGRGGTLIAINSTNTPTDPPCLSVGGWQGVGDCTLNQLSGNDCDLLQCAVTITENTQSDCIENGLSDYFTLTINASQTNGGSHYQVLVDGTQIGGNTPFGSKITIANGINGAMGALAADGSSTYPVVVRDAITQTCLDSFTTAIVSSCDTSQSAHYVLERENGSINTCSGIFTDSGDLSGNYSDSENDTITFCSNMENHVTISFENFYIESNQDLLYVYDGSNTAAEQIPGSPFSGFGPSNSPGVVVSTGRCLTFRFISNGSVNELGWKAKLKCTGSNVAAEALNWTGYPYVQNCVQSAQIGGTVYEDINDNGQKDVNEPGIDSISVTIFDDTGQVGLPIFTDTSGNYTFSSLSDTTVYRIEFTLPDYFEIGSFGSSSSSSVQFAQGGKCDVDLGLIDLYNICPDDNPEWAVPCYVNGNSQHASNDGNTALAKFRYNDSGNSPASSFVEIIESQVVGSTWGLAFNSNTNEVYLGSALKRHSGLGPLGIGAIYQHQLGTSADSVSLLYDFGANAGVVDVDSIRFPGTGNALGEEGPCASCDNVDSTVFPLVGKVGLGDIDITSDMQSIFVVNLFDRQVYQINTVNPTLGSATPLSAQPWLSNTICTNGIARPWALKIRRGKLYVGVVCDASSSTCNNAFACNDLTAILYSYDLSSSVWTQEFTLPLTYYRQTLANGSNYWVKWIDDFADMESFVYNVDDAQFSQPIFADIEFDNDGSLIMGFADRTVFQMAYQTPAPNRTYSDVGERVFSHGDILRAYYNPNSKTYELENDGIVGPLTTTNSTTQTGIGGKSFYWGDWWFGNTNNAGVGALAMKPGSGEVMFVTADIIDPFTNGVVWLNNTNGSSNRKLEVYQGTFNNSGTFAKGAGLGDMEIFCSAPLTEIGNYVWWDLDKDGLMDPSEPGISSLPIQLYLDPDGNTNGNNSANGDEILVANTTTDSFGRYIFRDTSNTNGLSPEVWTNGHTQILNDTVYQVRISNFASDSILSKFQSTYGFSSLSITLTMNHGVAGQKRDNNAYLDGIHATASIRVGCPGCNDHSIDFGFTDTTFCNQPLVLAQSNTPCVGDTLNLTTNVSGGMAPYTYNWSGPNAFNSSLPNPLISSASALSHGIYSLTVTDNIGCTDTLSMMVHVNILSTSTSLMHETCDSTNGSIAINIISGLNPLLFDWDNDGTGDNDDPQILTNLSEGTYNVTVLDGNGCTSSHSVAITNTSAPSINLVAIVDDSCTISSGSIDVTIIGANNISWSNGPTTEDVFNLGAGNYSVVASNAFCSTMQSFNVLDTCPPPIMDLAMIKTMADLGRPVMWGDTLEYTIHIYNQGTMVAQNVEIVDYIPTGLIFSTKNMPLWSTDTEGKARTTWTNQILPGDSATLDISLVVKQQIQSHDIVNFAEISHI